MASYHQSEEFSCKVKEGIRRARARGKIIGGFMDLTDKSFGKLTVRTQASNGKCGRVRWRCECECGKFTNVFSYNLISGKTRSCGCKQGTRKDSPINCLLYRYTYGAKKRGIPFFLTREEFTFYLSKNCSYCGVAPYTDVAVNCPGHSAFRYNGIDRIDNNNLGYVISNCVTCCKSCNRMKSDFSEVGFLAQIRRIYEFTTTKPNKPSDRGVARYAMYLSGFKNTSRTCPSKPETPINILMYDYRLSAERRKLDFSLSKDNLAILTQSDCHYCGAQPERTLRKYTQFRWNGIDRIDSAKGYVGGNVVPCCKSCNGLKSDKSREEFLRLVVAIYHHRIGREATA